MPKDRKGSDQYCGYCSELRGHISPPMPIKKGMKNGNGTVKSKRSS